MAKVTAVETRVCEHGVSGGECGAPATKGVYNKLDGHFSHPVCEGHAAWYKRVKLGQVAKLPKR